MYKRECRECSKSFGFWGARLPDYSVVHIKEGETTYTCPKCATRKRFSTMEKDINFPDLPIVVDKNEVEVKKQTKVRKYMLDRFPVLFEGVLDDR